MQSCLCSKLLLNGRCCSSGVWQLGAWIPMFHRHYVTSKCQEMIIQWCVIPKQNGILNHTAVKTSKLVQLNCGIYKFEKVCIASLLFDCLKNCRIHDKFSVLKCVFYSSLNFYMKCFYSIKYFVNFAMDTQTRIFIQCRLIGAFTKMWTAIVSFVMSV